MVNTTAGFLLAAYLLYMIARGDLGRLLWIIGVSDTQPSPSPSLPALPTLPSIR